MPCVSHRERDRKRGREKGARERARGGGGVANGGTRGGGQSQPWKARERERTVLHPVESYSAVADMLDSAVCGSAGSLPLGRNAFVFPSAVGECIYCRA